MLNEGETEMYFHWTGSFNFPTQFEFAALNEISSQMLQHPHGMVEWLPLDVMWMLEKFVGVV